MVWLHGLHLSQAKYQSRFIMCFRDTLYSTYFYFFSKFFPIFTYDGRLPWAYKGPCYMGTNSPESCSTSWCRSANSSEFDWRWTTAHRSSTGSCALSCRVSAASPKQSPKIAHLKNNSQALTKFRTHIVGPGC